MIIQSTSKKITALLLSIFLILATFSGCTSATTNKDASAKSTSSSTLQSSTAPVSRLSDIMDSKKYAGKFTVRVFTIAEKDKKNDGTNNSGDVILLQTPDDINMLIDTGHKSTIGSVIPHIKKLGVTKLDYLLITHTHGDHVGGLAEVLVNFPVDTIMASRHATRSNSSARIFQSALNEKGKSFNVIKEGDTFNLGKDIKVEVLNPEDKDFVIPDEPLANGDKVNEESVVLKMTYGSKSFLLCADIQRETEGRLVEKYGDKLNVDFIKVPHHGYNTSSTTDFIKASSPDIAFIPQCQIPDMEVLRKYQNANCKVYFNGMDGNMLAVCDGKSINIITEKDRKKGALQP